MAEQVAEIEFGGEALVTMESFDLCPGAESTTFHCACFGNCKVRWFFPGVAHSLHIEGGGLTVCATNGRKPICGQGFSSAYSPLHGYNIVSADRTNPLEESIR